MARNTPEALLDPEVETDETEYVEDSAESAESADEATEEDEVEIDLTDFVTAADAAIAEADSATGDLSEAAIQSVKVTYQALPGIKGKNRGKNHLTELLKQHMEGLDIVKARAVMLLQEKAAVSATPQSTYKRKTVDPNEAYADHLTILTLALWLATQNAPEDVNLEKANAVATERANAAFATATEVFNSDEPATADRVISRAVKTATVRRTRGPGGKRRNLNTHFSEALENVESGAWVSAGDIRKFESSEYGTDFPSAGAIQNRLEPKDGETSIPGVRVERRSHGEKENVLGVVKL